MKDKSMVKVRWKKNPDELKYVSYTLTLVHQMIGETAIYNDVRPEFFYGEDLHRLIDEFIKECV